MPVFPAPEPAPVPWSTPAPPSQSTEAPKPASDALNDLIALGRKVPLFVLCNDKGQLYLIPDNAGRQVLHAYSTASMARQLKERITVGNAGLGNALRVALISLAEAMAMAGNPKQPMAIALMSPAFEVAEGRKRVKPGGLGSPMAMPVFVVRNGADGGLMQLGAGEKAEVPAYLSFAEASEAFEAAKKIGGAKSAKLEIEAAEIRDFLEALRKGGNGPNIPRFRLVPPRESVEAARGIGRPGSP